MDTDAPVPTAHLQSLPAELLGNYFSDGLRARYDFHGIRQLADGWEQVVITCKGCSNKLDFTCTKKGPRQSWKDLKDKLNSALNKAHGKCKTQASRPYPPISLHIPHIPPYPSYPSSFADPHISIPC